MDRDLELHIGVALEHLDDVFQRGPRRREPDHVLVQVEGDALDHAEDRGELLRDHVRAAIRVLKAVDGLGLVRAGIDRRALFAVRETRHHVAHEARQIGAPAATLSPREVFWRTTWRDRNLASISQAGLVNNRNDGMAWGYAVGAVLAGLTADALGLAAAMWVVAALTLASGLQVALRMQETHRR